ncbi:MULTISPECIES: CdiA family toxin C-terminal domain-containing protein [Clostridium]|uniref:CdiA family toxin C-terminal domain-containing protein n=1 Tax=Clostridium TaxID=1485 RepID=UPI001FA84E6E|nr:MULTISPECIES: CdiA family toxin C-terminal domain-containing protein [Clostridium]
MLNGWNIDKFIISIKKNPTVDEYAKNRLKFKGYIDGETGEITNFFSTLNCMEVNDDNN